VEKRGRAKKRRDSVAGMNFFGHAWVAAWFSECEPFLLGSMLPDLANALRSAVPRSSHDQLCAGIRIHHETDRVFHATDAFQALEHHARRSLGAAGLSKGPRRALAHIGVEFLIDDELGTHGAPGARHLALSRYIGALAFGGSRACRSMLHWSNTSDADRFALLCSRLALASSAVSTATPSTGGHPEADRLLAARLIACLAGRPRLELHPSEEAALEPWLAECRPAVAAATPGLLVELSRGLEAPASMLLAAAE
jgi:hypothetical protein